MQSVLPDALSFALLGAIELLLSAIVADGMTGRRHRPNMELVAQGLANIASAVFGGICATGTVARTTTNVRAGARSPLAGVFHAGFILLFMMVAAPLASFIPLDCLTGVLAVVAWGMAEKHEFATLIGTSWGDAVVLLTTFGLTVFRSLSEAIVVGFALGALLFIHRMSQATGIEQHGPLVPEYMADDVDERPPHDASVATDPDIAVYRITGAFFFGAAPAVGTVLDRIAHERKNLILDFSAVPFRDSTAANIIEVAVHKADMAGLRFFIAGASPSVAKALELRGVRSPRVHFTRSLVEAQQQLRKLLLTA
jgi:SulP family sulfate permease